MSSCINMFSCLKVCNLNFQWIEVHLQAPLFPFTNSVCTSWQVIPNTSLVLFISFTHIVGEGNGTPLWYSCLEIPIDGGAWWAAVHGVARVWHDWATSLSLFTFVHWRRKRQPTPVFLPGKSQRRGAWWAAVYGVAQSRTRPKRLSSSSSSCVSIIEKSIHQTACLLFVRE